MKESVFLVLWFLQLRSIYLYGKFCFCIFFHSHSFNEPEVHRLLISSFITKSHPSHNIVLNCWTRWSWMLFKMWMTNSPTLQAWGCSRLNRMNFCRFRSFNGHITLWQAYLRPRLNEFDSPWWYGRKKTVVISYIKGETELDAIIVPVNRNGWLRDKRSDCATLDCTRNLL